MFQNQTILVTLATETQYGVLRQISIQPLWSSSSLLIEALAYKWRILTHCYCVAEALYS